MSINRRANAVMFGFDFQVNAAIVLMLENIEDLKTLRLEGNCEDIELELNNSECVLAQAKAIENSSSDFHNVRANLNKALNSLSEGAYKSNATQLILITNSPNPLNDKISRNLFLGAAHREYKTLPKSSQNIIDGYLNKIKNPLDVSKFMIQILPFETDNEFERYKIVRQTVDDFVGGLVLNIPGISKMILRMWQNDVFKNGSKKNVAITLKKSDIIWPIMVIATDIKRIDEEFEKELDVGLYEEITFKYKEIIDSCCERCEFFIKVLCDYNSFQSKKNLSEKPLDFSKNKWVDYKEELNLVSADEEIEKRLIQIILYSIVKNRRVIDRIKKGVKL